jgi:transcription elongation factor
VIALLHMANSTHDLRSAFTRGSIRGSIYLECQMNGQLLNLLKIIPGLSRANRGTQMRRIDFADYTNLLCMESLKFSPAIGNWVRVRKGIYKGDIGRVSAIHAWGVELHLIPRILIQQPDNTLKRKAKAVSPEAKLFDPKEFEKNSLLKLITRGNRSYKIGRLLFENGLLRQTYNYHSISSPVDQIPWRHFSMFLSSSHPDIPPFGLPRPQEWSFVIGDDITFFSSARKGRITLIKDSYAEVETDEGLLHISWHEIWKHFKVGDYVRIAGGLNANASGWVIEIKEDVATIAEKTIKGKITSNFSEAINVSHCES